ncbi:tripartite motif-containing protein 59 isoform X1 [Octopus bimaculoides]|uniref:tripartite motif-containing protein 59 isoform X1 n=1 Tax=Octopus bimaculoides TaxID=37653 RepID=UPI00071DF925|nr:tripartite motif-containing protein 59 isoform X1 [Octopus bimaculoides]|eukprot:XP_014777574.1 PREDICTED: tripartite motif-containing protein 59-like [Octopus bimaculoides]
MTECTQEYLEEKFRQFRDPNSEEDNTENSDKKTQPSSKLVEKTLRKRKLVFDEEHFQDAFLRCIICRDVYNDTNKAPKSLPCQHCFCLNCFLEMFRVEGEYRQSLTSAFRGMPRAVKIQCPTCRESIIASEDDLRRLPNQNSILELLKFVEQTGITDISYCSKHQLQPINFFCELCSVAVCSDCTVIDHKEINGHNVMSIDEALKKYTPVINDSIEDMEIQKQKYREKRLQILQRMEDVNKMEKRVAAEIKEAFQFFRNAIIERERNITSMAEQEANRKRTHLNENLRQITEKEEGMTERIRILNAAKTEKDIPYMFSTYSAAQDSLSDNIELPHRMDDGFDLSFHYKTEKLDTVTWDLKEFGFLTIESS